VERNLPLDAAVEITDGCEGYGLLKWAPLTASATALKSDSTGGNQGKARNIFHPVRLTIDEHW
jgi:hypothetical protein